MENFQEEEEGGKLSRKIKENPFVPIGIVGMILTCGYGAYKFKNRGNTSISVYVTQLRVVAQGAVVGALVFGLACKMIKENFFKETTSDKS